MLLLDPQAMSDAQSGAQFLSARAQRMGPRRATAPVYPTIATRNGPLLESRTLFHAPAAIALENE